jgi:hypothetical protein
MPEISKSGKELMRAIKIAATAEDPKRVISGLLDFYTPVSSESSGSYFSPKQTAFSLCSSNSLIIPDGERIAATTLNPKVGIEGGISILGTTGFVEPWDDHLSESVVERVKTADRAVLTTGRIGLRHARLLFPEYEVILVGAKLKESLSVAPKDTVLCGLPGLILKFLNPQDSGSVNIH